MIKYNPQFLKKLEEIFEENGYKVRFEKGNFKSGFCVMEDRKLIVINKFAVIESRINTMVEILKQLGQQGLLSGDNFEQVYRAILKNQKVEENAG